MASIEATEEPSREAAFSSSQIAAYGLLAVVLAGLVNGLVRTLVITIFGVPSVFALRWEPVLVASAVGAIGATIVYALLTQVSSRPNRTFTIVAVIVLVLSFAGPLSALLSPPPELAEAPWTVFATLVAMHVAAAATIISILTRSTNPGGTSR